MPSKGAMAVPSAGPSASPAPRRSRASIPFPMGARGGNAWCREVASTRPAPRNFYRVAGNLAPARWLRQLLALYERGQHVDGNGEDDGGILFRRDLGQRLQ